MCGIFGYTGYRRAAPCVVAGLKRLEYRGYDSFGVATRSWRELHCSKHSGRIVTNGLVASGLPGTMGIGHTRWATHGAPTADNAHPHMDCKSHIAVVHNGIIENYVELKMGLIGRGHRFLSDTDTEVIPHLIEERMASGLGLHEAVRVVCKDLKGTFALLVIADGCDEIVVTRRSSPVVIGIGDGEMVVASDVIPLLEFTKRVIYLEDGDVACICESGVKIFTDDGEVVRKETIVCWTPTMVDKGDYQDFMLKEILEFPNIVSRFPVTIDPNLPEAIVEGNSIAILACGSSFYAGMVFKYLLDEVCGTSLVSVHLASEFKYHPKPYPDVVIGISQSGETADTLTALDIAKKNGADVISITNVPGSSIERMSDYTAYMQADPEMGVAATKSFNATLLVAHQIVDMIRFDDASVGFSLDTSVPDLSRAVSILRGASDIFYIGRGIFYPLALEGALKMKEVSYIHAEGFAGGELKHGSFALLTSETPVVVICTEGDTQSAMVSTIREISSRGSPVIAVCDRDSYDLVGDIVSECIVIPGDTRYSKIMQTSVALQLLAYYTASSLHCDVDCPRNLAKSVTVE